MERMSGTASVAAARRHRDRLRPRGRASDIVRSGEFPADVPVDADGLETERPMQCDARIIRKRDAGVGPPESLSFEDSKETFVQTPADAGRRSCADGALLRY